MSLARYARWMSVSHLVFWSLFLVFGAIGGFNLLQRDGRVPLRAAIWLAAWGGFFVGFVTAVTTTLRARRGLLVGFLQPTADEWRRLESLAPGRRDGIWDTVLIAAVGSACAAGGIAAVAWLAGPEAGLGRLGFALAAAVVPALGSALVAWLCAQRSVIRFVGAMELDRPRQMKRSTYLLLHNVLPYALFSTTVGLAVAVSRFLPAALEGRPVDAVELSRHLALTALIISLLVVAAARLKTRIDFLSPLILVPANPTREARGPGWRIWYALAAPVLVFAALRLGFLAAGLDTVGLATALWLKVIVCLLFAFGTAWWAVRSVLAEMESEGLDEHRYVRVYRFLARTGFTAR